MKTCMRLMDELIFVSFSFSYYFLIIIIVIVVLMVLLWCDFIFDFFRSCCLAATN